ncbi:NAD(P)-dependent alcohol dehydrogenase [Luteipulveratus halotolerans]|uniref:Alcohol dehydrogenase n=1 Tax=Luteipulveratus halotolerans TaxID=1631356 RepID=A0A0L6CM17_9MICO|nr:NAD(P)-dependent alcohol dehydrogenase [Luteipulveratus halotolerans]KNX38846.1 alcohol dehydrogenase [Luteipulveratus halotolerans]
MRAAVFDTYGPPDVVRVEEVPSPRPHASQVLVRVVATTVSVGDARIRGSRFPRGMTAPARAMFGVRRPRRHVLGGPFSGVVEAVGTDVDDYAVGDEVCGISPFRSMGAHAELVAVQANRLARKPDDVSHDDAAGVLFGGTTALTYLRDKASVRRGQHVLVNGASGAVGSNVVQLAKYYGATVTAITSATNLDLVTSLGADTVVDYTQTPPTQIEGEYDVVVDTVGNVPAATWKRLLTPGSGLLLLVVADLATTIRATGNVKTGPASERREDVEMLLRLLEAGRLQVVIDSTYDLDQVAEAHARVDTGHKVGNVMLRP